MSDERIPELTALALLDRHAGVLLDAYGVLVDSRGALPGASALIDALNRRGQPYAVLTNDASRLPETSAARFAALGLHIPAERVVSSGALLAPYFAAHGLAGARCIVLGTPDACAFVERAGGVLIPPAPDAPLDALVLADEGGYPLLATLDAVLSALFRAVDAGRTPALLLPNPDLIYPKARGEYGIAAGSLALILERALALRYGAARALAFTPLGKPYGAIFDEACQRLGTRDAVMIGDQLATDIRGARDYGIAAALVVTGLTHHAPEGWNPRPDYVVPSLA